MKIYKQFLKLSFVFRFFIWLGAIVLNMLLFEILAQTSYNTFGFLSLDNPFTFYPMALFWIALPFLIIFIEVWVGEKRKAIQTGDFTLKRDHRSSFINEKVGSVAPIGDIPIIYCKKGLIINIIDKEFINLDDIEYYPYTGKAKLFLRSHDYAMYSGREWIISNKSIRIKLNNKTFRQTIPFSGIKSVNINGNEVAIDVESRYTKRKADSVKAYAIAADIVGEEIAKIVSNRIANFK